MNCSCFDESVMFEHNNKSLNIMQLLLFYVIRRALFCNFHGILTGENVIFIDLKPFGRAHFLWKIRFRFSLLIVLLESHLQLIECVDCHSVGNFSNQKSLFGVLVHSDVINSR